MLLKHSLRDVALLLLLIIPACSQPISPLSSTEKQVCQKPFQKVIDSSKAGVDGATVRKELVEAGTLFLNTCLLSDIPAGDQQTRLSELKEFAKVVPSSQDCRLRYLPGIQLMDLDGDNRDEVILHTQVPNCGLLSMWGGNGASIIYHQDNSTKVWAGTLIWPCLDVDCTATTLWTQSPEPMVQNLPVHDSQGRKFTLVAGRYLGADHVGEILNIWRWNNEVPTIVKSIELSNWCGDFETWDKWSVTPSGVLVLPNVSETYRCAKQDSVKYVLKGDEFEIDGP